MLQNKRWRGRMPFRTNRKIGAETFEHKGRTGEPSPATFIQVWRSIWTFREAGNGKSRGSFTESLRKTLAVWLKENLGNFRGPVTFQYRLSRKKVILVTMAYPTIYHRKHYGEGSKGFVLAGRVLSVDGVPPDRWNLRADFALSRIIGQHPIRILALPAPRQ